MSESEVKFVDAVTRLLEKMEAYDKRIMTLGSDISKAQSQVEKSSGQYLDLIVMSH
jgi:chaperonin cofactor prefoldin